MSSLRLMGLVAVTALFVTGCGGGSGSSNSDGLVRKNTGVAISVFNNGLVSLNGLVYFLASESDQAGTDLNGDGDAADAVVHVVDPDTNTVTNLGRSASSGPVVIGALIVWLLSENDEGNFDFSGDGDLGDQVITVYDPTMPLGPGNPAVTPTTGAANTPLRPDGTTVVLLASEIDDGADISGDGEIDDLVVRSRDLVTGVVFNAPLVFDIAAFMFDVGNGFTTFAVSEVETGMTGTDLNGDTDSGDTVLFGMNLTTGVSFPVGPGGTPRAVAGTVEIAGTPAAPVFAYAVDEISIGLMGTNFNSGMSDVDVSDQVLALWDVMAGTETFPLGGIAIDGAQISGTATRVAFVGSEDDNGSVQDFNSDADFLDEVPFWMDLAATGLANSVGIAAELGQARIQLCDSYMIFIASESDDGVGGTNFNAASGDSDTDDAVAHFLDITGPGASPRNTGFATQDILCFEGENALFLTAPESAQGTTDINGDGDTSDIVPIYFRVDPATMNIVRGVSAIIIDGPISFQICPTQIRIWGNSSEMNLNADFNEDGDLDDFHLVASRIRRSDGLILSFNVVHTSDRDGSAFPFVADADTIVFPFAEEMFLTGLNANSASGDTDVNDLVLYFVQATCL
ncbi:MAG: hypothetical protein CMJ83_09310 [Planctomycetes bacterium]|nr:hypothetical protein [Planctomycetota bacterium]